MATRIWFALVLPVGLLVACSSNGTPPEADLGSSDLEDSGAVLTPDAPPPDTTPVEDGPSVITPDGPPVDTATTGKSCTLQDSTDVCGANSACLFERDGQQTGVCAATGCTMGAGDTCGAGFQCVSLGDSGTGCLKLCEPVSGGNDCGDPTSVCHPLADYCTGACAADAECGTGYYCNPVYKVCMAAGDNAAAAIGDACAADTDCPRNGVCAPEASGFPGGYCIILACSFDSTNFACPEGSLCAPTQGGDSFCLASCDMATPMCREGYGCMPIQGLGAACVAPQN